MTDRASHRGSPRTPRLGEVSIEGGFWGRWDSIHRENALDHQWRQLDATGAIDNFRIVAGASEGVRFGNLASDSDVYKWVDAASRALAAGVPERIEERLEQVIGLIEAAQEPDGYLSTWIQAQFPGQRFANLELEHELYCLGHLIEAGIAHHEATGSDRLLSVARRAADLLVSEFWDAPAGRLDGHEGIELALIRLFRSTGESDYLELSRRFVERRGVSSVFIKQFAPSLLRTAVHLIDAKIRQARFRRQDPDTKGPAVEANRKLRIPWRAVPQLVVDTLTGRTFQMEKPVRELDEPTGHAVRFIYLQTALAMMARESDDTSLADATLRAWDALVDGHMFVSGGTGAIPLVEGFGRKYDLDPETAYAETCAAIGGTVWDRELGLLTGEARFDDLFEWQLLNAAAVGVGAKGSEYFYDNPLRSRGDVERRPWFPIPCCPSNLSRLWMSLGTNQYSWTDGELRIHQYFSGRAEISPGIVEIDSQLPWRGEVAIRLTAGDPGLRRVVVRVPGWAGVAGAWLDDTPVATGPSRESGSEPTASGLDPWKARWLTIEVEAGSGREIHLEFEMPVRMNRQDDRVPRVGGWVALSRGPLLYCIEGIDHDCDVLDVEVDPESATSAFDPDFFGGATVIEALSVEGRRLRFVPYFLWGNRGKTPMSAFVRAAG